MRLENSLKNSSISFILNIIKLFISFFLRRYFLIKLGQEYLGLNSLLINVISMFSLIELGLGSAIGYSLYEPLSLNDEIKISERMNFFKGSYRKISILIFMIGILFFPFLKNIINGIGAISRSTINIAYGIFVVDAGISYLLSYKKILLESDQKNYKVNLVNTYIFVTMSLIQFLILFYLNNFLIYIAIKIIFNLAGNYWCSKIVDKNYSFLKKYDKVKLQKEEKNNILTNIKAMVLHKVGDICINSTDNIIIAKYISLSMVGIFSNYMMIISAVQGIIIQVFSSITASLGNLITHGDTKKTHEIFKVLNMIGFLIFGLLVTVFYTTIQTFIRLWIGDKNVVEGSFLIILSLNMYVTGMRVVTGTIKSAAGLYTQDKYSPIIQAFINLFFSILLVKKMGLVGILIGTLISSLIPTIYRPYVLYKFLFKEKLKIYFIEYIKYAGVTTIAIIMAGIIQKKILLDPSIVNLIVGVIISSFSFFIVASIAVLKTKEFEYLKNNIILKVLRR